MVSKEPWGNPELKTAGNSYIYVATKERFWGYQNLETGRRSPSVLRLRCLKKAFCSADAVTFRAQRMEFTDLWKGTQASEAAWWGCYASPKSRWRLGPTAVLGEGDEGPWWGYNTGLANTFLFSSFRLPLGPVLAEPNVELAAKGKM